MNKYPYHHISHYFTVEWSASFTISDPHYSMTSNRYQPFFFIPNYCVKSTTINHRQPPLFQCDFLALPWGAQGCSDDSNWNWLTQVRCGVDSWWDVWLSWSWLVENDDWLRTMTSWERWLVENHLENVFVWEPAWTFGWWRTSLNPCLVHDGW